MEAALTAFACSRVVSEHQLKRLGDFLISAIAYLSSALFIYFVFLLGFSFINDKSFTFFRQIRTCALRIPIPAPARNSFSLLSLPLQANSSQKIAGFHVTSRRPCWWSRTKAFLSSGNLTLFSCKFFEKKKILLQTTNMAALSRGCKSRKQSKITLHKDIYQ